MGTIPYLVTFSLLTYTSDTHIYTWYSSYVLYISNTKDLFTFRDAESSHNCLETLTGASTLVQQASPEVAGWESSHFHRDSKCQSGHLISLDKNPLSSCLRSLSWLQMFWGLGCRIAWGSYRPVHSTELHWIPLVSPLYPRSQFPESGASLSPRLHPKPPSGMEVWERLCEGGTGTGPSLSVHSFTKYYWSLCN